MYVLFIYIADFHFKMNILVITCSGFVLILHNMVPQIQKFEILQDSICAICKWSLRRDRICSVVMMSELIYCWLTCWHILHFARSWGIFISICVKCRSHIDRIHKQVAAMLFEICFLFPLHLKPCKTYLEYTGKCTVSVFHLINLALMH